MKEVEIKKIIKDKVTIILTIISILAVLGIIIFSTLRENYFKASGELAVSKAYQQVKDGDEEIEDTPFVTFDAFFLRDLTGDGKAEGIRGSCRNVGESDTLYMELNVLTDGYLEDGIIKINSENFYFQTAIPSDKEIKENAIGTNIKEIKLNTIKNGTQKLLTGKTASGNYTYSSSRTEAIGNNVNNYSKVNSITLTGTHVSDEGVRTPITKTVEFTIDWHGYTKAQLYSTSQTGNIETAINEENQELKLNFTVNPYETKEELILKDVVVTGTIPKFNNYMPSRVECTSSNVKFNYNDQTGEFTATRESILNNETGIVTNTLSRTNSFSITVVYPLEAYTSLGEEYVTLKIPVTAYYDGHNNPNGTFNNPEKSNTVKDTIILTYKKINKENRSPYFSITVGKYINTPSGYRYVISKEKPLRIYNGISSEETDDNYIVKWYGYTGTNGEFDKIVMTETKTGEETKTADKFIKTDSNSYSMEELTTNIGIYFSGATNILGEDGEIKVFDDETDELLATFTSKDWGTYTESNPYKYQRAVKHIRVETSKTKAEEGLYVYNIKQLDDEYITEHFERPEFDNLEYIESTLNGYLGETGPSLTTGRAYYQTPYTIANLGLDRTTIGTQTTEKNMKFTISATANEYMNQVKWINGSFLIKMPQDIINIEINDVKIANKQIKLKSYEQFKENEINYIKINTENNQASTFDIEIDADVTADPRMITKTEAIQLYYSNENAVEYWNKVQDEYDVNDNLNKTEIIGKATLNLEMISPTSLLTCQTTTNYDEEGNTTVAPQVAIVARNRQSAEINIEVTNNYSSTISKVVILGKIPYTGNKYVINGENLGSNFDAKILEKITVPENLKSVAKIYYSENGDATKDIKLDSNKWIPEDQVTDFTNIKSYLIDLGDYKLEKTSTHKFTYKIAIPANLQYNQVSFSHHAVYFSLDTDQGRYETKTEPNKLGFMIAKQYDLELEKYQTGKSKLVPGATYLITEYRQEEGKTRVTNEDGKLTLKDLYVDRKYSVKEIKSPENYELNENIITFKAIEKDGKLELDTKETSGNPKNITVVKPEGESGYKVKLQVEDEAKASLKITKAQKDANDTKLKGIRFTLTGKNFEQGKTITTNASGEATVKGLSVGQEYTLQETKATGYYIENPIKFTIVNNGENYEIKYSEEENLGNQTVKITQVTENDFIPEISLTIENEKIPTYNLQINKVAKGEEEKPLEGAKFRLYKGDQKIGDYVSDSQGIITIDDLYQYEDARKVDQTYTLKELLSPDGYAAVKDITFQVSKNSEGLLTMEVKNGQIKEQTSDGNKITITIEDSPSFKLIKEDGETHERLPNTKFAIYNVDDGTEQLALDSKFNILGQKEEINGKTYYTLTTNSKGEIEANLREGLYKAVEIQASDDKYDITDNVYYFGIGASREAPEEIFPTQVNTIAGTDNTQIKSIDVTADGGYIAGGYFEGTIQIGENTYRSKDMWSAAMLIIKYTPEGEIEWVSTGKGEYDNGINSVAGTTDGGWIVGGYSYGDIQIGDKQYTSNAGIGIVIKYTKDGNIAWVHAFENNTYLQGINAVSEKANGGYIAVGTFNGKIKIEGEEYTNKEYNSSDGVIIEYTEDGKVEGVNTFGGTGDDKINSVIETEDEGYIIGGYFTGTIQIGEKEYISKGEKDGIIIKYTLEGEAEWVQTFGEASNDEVHSVITTEDGGYIIGGYFTGTIQIGEKEYISKGEKDGIIIKYTSEGEAEWVQTFGGTSNDEVHSVIATENRGCIVGGYFTGTIQIGEKLYTSKGKEDAIIIKYTSEGKAEWTKTYEGWQSDKIFSVAVTADENYMVGGYFTGTIQVGEGSYTSKGNYNSGGIIIKYENVKLNNPTVVSASTFGGMRYDEFTSIAETADGGYVVGGSFEETIEINGKKYKANGSLTRSDGIVIKYAPEGEIEWVQTYGGSEHDAINSIVGTTDGGCIVGGYFTGTIKIGENSYTSKGSYDGIVIKYTSEGEKEWVQTFGGLEYDEINSVVGTTDGGCVVGGHFRGTVQIGENSYTSKGSYDGIIIKYTEEGEVEWVQTFGGLEYDEINSVVETVDEGCVVGGYFSGTVQIGENLYTSKGKTDGVIIKYTSKGEVERVQTFGGTSEDRVSSVAVTEDKGYVVGGSFEGTIQIGENSYTSGTGTKGIIIKYTPKGEVEWAKSVGKSNIDRISSISATTDGGCIAGGYFCTTIQIENYNLQNKGLGDVIIIKYTSKGEVEWAKLIGGRGNDFINSVIELEDGTILVGGEFESPTIEIDGKTLTNTNTTGSYSDAMLLRIANMSGVPEVQELTVQNKVKEFKITTDVEEINGQKGGSITGEGKDPYEKVRYGESSILPIKMEPQDENYEIIKVTVNGKEWDFKTNDDGTYTMPDFTDVKEDKHIVVTYAVTKNKITINKVDNKTQEPLQGVKFKLDQIEEREKPKDAIKDFIANGEEYPVYEEKDQVLEEGVLGDLTHNETDTYYFEEQDDGTYLPTNSKTYMGEKGAQNSTAHSYIPINLNGKDGKYVVVVNASIESESADKGYVVLNQSTSTPTNGSTGQFVNIYGTTTSVKTPTDYVSGALEGGKEYNLHFCYKKDNSQDTGADQLVIYSVRIYKASEITYSFVPNGKIYESNNQGKDNTTANSYVEIDLENCTGKYDLTVNAEVSSQSGDYGYATVTKTTNRVAYSNSTGRFIYISGEQKSKDYKYVLDGGFKYYLHFGYYKNSSGFSGSDKFTINSIDLSTNDSELNHFTVETDSKGKAVLEMPFGKYKITEVNTPEGYIPPEEAVIIEFKSDSKSVVGLEKINPEKQDEEKEEIPVLSARYDEETGEYFIENKQYSKVIVHHYLKDETGKTEIPVAEEQEFEGREGEKYKTEPHLDLEKYDLEKDEQGNYVTPPEATGEYNDGVIHVTYYYEEREIPLTVHHYIVDTQEPVPLKDGTLAKDVVDSGKRGTPYETEALNPDDLDPKYELVEDPTNKDGIYDGKEVIVTYYYKAKQVKVTTKVEPHMEINEQGEEVPVDGGTISGQNKDPYEIVIYGEDSKEEIIATPAEGYRVKSIKVNGTDEEFVVGENNTVKLNQFTQMIENKEVVVEFERIPAEVIVHHYITDTVQKVPSNVIGQVVQDEQKEGFVGDMYATMEASNIQFNYEYESNTDNASGIMREGKPIEVTYYYDTKDAVIENDTITKTGTPKITDLTDKVTYNITYTAKVTDYIGNVKVKIIDTLPYEIDSINSSLQDGDYNPSDRTITWEDTVYINPLEDENSTNIKITKQIEVLFTNIDCGKKSFVNEAVGTLIIEETDQEKSTEKVEYTTETEFLKDVTVKKVWDYTNNRYDKPSRIYVQLKKPDASGNLEVVQQKEVTIDSKTEEDLGENKEVWEVEFTKLDKYNDLGEEIDYVVEEAEVVEGELKYYKKEIDQEAKTITNTYKGAVISSTKEVSKENADTDYALEDEKLTYIITVKNTGEMPETVYVKDSIPTGTTFVPNSIKVDGKDSYEVDGKTVDLTNYDPTNLEKGIPVTVEGKTNVKVSFSVTVDKLPDGIFTAKILNTANVDNKDTNEEQTVVNKANIVVNKSSEPKTESKVLVDSEITYKIQIQNTGTAPMEVTVRDSIPENTTYVDESLTIEGRSEKYTIEELESGINLNVEPGENIIVKFTVKVNKDAENGTVIKNVAFINDVETNETTHIVKQSKLTTKKTQQTTENANYVSKGSIINYNITVTNEGDLGTVAIIKDNIPEGTSFVKGSIKINGQSTYNLEREEDLSLKTEKDLEQGIEVYVASQEDTEKSKVTLSFSVKVEKEQGTIKNSARIQDRNNPEKPEMITEEVEYPIITIQKKQMVNGLENKTEVKANDEITYTIVVKNTGEQDATNVEIKDIVPEGTTLKTIDESAKIVDNKNIIWIINSLPAGSMQEVTFTVEVNYIPKTKAEITNIAYINDVPSNETKVQYIKPDPSLQTSVVKDGDEKITLTDSLIYYSIIYTAKTDDFVGDSTITITDNLPYEIDEKASDLNGGVYSRENKTITWTETLEDINTFEDRETKEVTRIKQIALKYIYTDEETLSGNIENTVKTVTELKETIDDEPEKVVKTEEKQDNHIVVAEIPAKVVVHHYFYDKENGTETELQLAPDETITGIVGKNYTTSKSKKVSQNYSCRDENPENKSGKMTKTTTEVTYYYELIDEKISGDIEKTATANTTIEREVDTEPVRKLKVDPNTNRVVGMEVVENGESKTEIIPVLTDENGAVTYNIKHYIKIENYIGKATIQIVDKLPSGINAQKSELQGGQYDPLKRTITWEQDVQVNTYRDGTYNKTIEKQISIVYEGQNKVEDLENSVEGTVITYYPKEHPDKADEEKDRLTSKAESIVAQDYRRDLTLEKVWDDNQNKKGHRPESVRIQLIANKSILLDGEELPHVIISNETGWKYTFEKLRKYDNSGKEVNYSVREEEVNEDDLKYYDAPETILDNKLIVINRYKLEDTKIESDITKTGPEEITDVTKPVNYNITYSAVIKNYEGDAILTITDTLPFKIDKEKSNLNGGTYNEDLKTITWTENLDNINTTEDGDKQVKFNKQFTVVFSDLDAKEPEFTNSAKGRIEFTEIDKKNEVETEYTTKVNVEGKVVVKYVDIDTMQEIVRTIEEEPEEESKEENSTYGYEITGKVGETYKTEKKLIPGYEYVKDSGNTQGDIIEETTEVIYYYKKSESGGVKAKYVDEKGNEIAPEEIIEGTVDTPYKTEQKEIEDYEFVETTGDEPEGKLEERPKEVVYHYKKVTAKVVVRYLKKGTDEILAKEDVIKGNIGDQYETTRKVIEYFKPADPEPDNSRGKMEKNDNDNTIYVTYYYEKMSSGKVIVKYVDKETGEEITYTEDGNIKTYREELQGNVGDYYYTESKEIPYYTYMKELEPSNKDGVYKEESETIIYYYRKHVFNFLVDKEISSIRLNGQEVKIKDEKMMKVELAVAKIQDTKLEIDYNIMVKNVGDIAGKAKVEENVPRGLDILKETYNHWEDNANGKLTTEVELEPGQSIGIPVLVTWSNEKADFGQFKNTAKIVRTENTANYLETTQEDNESTAELIVAVKTGLERNMVLRIFIIITATIVSGGLFILLYQYETYQRERDREIRHVVLDGQNVIIVKKKQK